MVSEMVMNHHFRFNMGLIGSSSTYDVLRGPKTNIAASNAS